MEQLQCPESLSFLPEKGGVEVEKTLVIEHRIRMRQYQGCKVSYLGFLTQSICFPRLDFEISSMVDLLISLSFISPCLPKT